MPVDRDHPIETSPHPAAGGKLSNIDRNDRQPRQLKQPGKVGGPDGNWWMTAGSPGADAQTLPEY